MPSPFRFGMIALCVALVLYLLAAAVGLPAKDDAVVFVFAGLLAAAGIEYVLKRRPQSKR